LAALLSWIYRRIWPSADDGSDSESLFDKKARRFLIAFFLTSYAIWLWLFSVQRYLLALELLSGLALLALWDWCRWRVSRSIVLFLLSVLLVVISVEVPDWGHSPWQASWYGAKVPPALRAENAAFVLLSRPIAWLIPYFPASDRFISVKGPVSLHYTEAARRRIRALIDSGTGGRFTLGFQDEYQANRSQYDEWLRPYGYRLATDGCLIVESRLRNYISCPLAPLKLKVHHEPVRKRAEQPPS